MNPKSALRKCFLSTTRLLRGLPLLAALGFQLGAATYYVDYAAGADLNIGTSPTSAWQHSPGDLAATAMPAGITLMPGDTVNFKGGVTYVLTGSAGIAVRSNGTSSSPITYDGNSTGTWGAGRARFTDNHGSAGLTAFTATAPASWLVFKNLEITAVGGAATLPVDGGSPARAKFGGGIAFLAGAAHTNIESCAFSQLGYAFNEKPMAATSLAGTGILLRGADTVAVTGCDFSGMNLGIDLGGTGAFANSTITNCTFHDSVVWTVNQSAEAAAGVVLAGCSETNNAQFDRAAWKGYGDHPRLLSKTAAEGTSVSLTATAAALPIATFQWQKNGQPLSGATNPTLSLAAVSTADAGTYTAIATNSLGSSVSNEVALIVTSSNPSSGGTAPVFTTQPASQTAAEATTVTFTVAATGSPTPTIQWFRNGITFSTWTGSTLTLEGISSNDVGTYVAVATNSAGRVTSNPATLTIGSQTTPPPPTESGTGAPVFTTQPMSQTAAEMTSVTFTVAATGSPTPTIQWFRNGITFSTWTGPTLKVEGISSNDVGSYTAVATNSAGTTTSNAATLTLSTATTPTGGDTGGSGGTTTSVPVFTTQPANQSAAAGATVTFAAVVSGSPTPTIAWFRNGATFPGWTGATLVLETISTNDLGTYVAVASNSAGTVTSNEATLSIAAPVVPTSTAPSFTRQPLSQTSAPHSSVTFTVEATGSPTPTIRWYRDGATFPSWTGATLTLKGLSNNDAGSYIAVATNSAGTAKSNAAILTVAKVRAATTSSVTSAASRLVNLSVRADAGSGDESLIVGFVVAGDAEKSLLIRGSGPALAAFGITGALADPTLSLYSGAQMVAANDDWNASADAASIAPTSQRVGAFALPEASRDAALLADISAGAYTGQISTKDAATGTALIEVYDAAPETSARLTNVSVRTLVKAGGTSPAIGFVVAGTEPKRLLIRAVGPSLTGFGIADPLSDPQLSIYAGNTAQQENDNWSGSAELDAAFTEVGAFPLRDAASKDSALIFTAAPGAYTAVISSASNSGGTVLVEVYELP